MIQTGVIVSLLILSLRLSNVVYLWKRDLSEEIKPLLWIRIWERKYVLDIGYELIFVKIPPKRMKKSPKYNEINVYHLEGKILRNI